MYIFNVKYTMKEKRIVVVGSCNTDMVVRVDHLPLPGETIIGYDLITNQGGKGANQAVAVSRLGGSVSFVARVGADSFGEHSIELLKGEGIDVSFVKQTEGVPTGVALIPVDSKGENSIIVASGANAQLSEQDIIDAQDIIKRADVLLMQLETPIETILAAARMAHAQGAMVILNPAPFPKEPLPAELLELVDIITPNETEASMMSGIQVVDEESAANAIAEIQSMGVGSVIITAGGKGAYTLNDGTLCCVPAYPSEVVDTTAAGDTFCGALSVALCEGNPLLEGIRFANKAASISVTRVGAWCSIPHRSEL